MFGIDRDMLLIVGGLLLTSRAWKGALFGWLADVYQAGRWLRRTTLAEVYSRLHIVETRLDEHETDRELHRLTANERDGV